MKGFEKETSSLMRKMEARKGRGVKISGEKRKTCLSSWVEMEIRKLECSVNYNSSSLSIGEEGGTVGFNLLL